MSAMSQQPAEVASLPRTSSVQRMLELERQIKIEQMQAHGFTDKKRAKRASSRSSSQTLSTPTVPSYDAFSGVKIGSSNSANDSARQHSAKRTGTGRSLHITVPQTISNNNNNNSPHRGHPTMAELLAAPADGERNPPSSQDDDLESEARSSICQSPTWESYGRRRQQKKLDDGKAAESPKTATAAGAAARENDGHARLTKRRAPTKPPSASRTRFLMGRQTGLLSSQGPDGDGSSSPSSNHHQRGRSASTGEEQALSSIHNAADLNGKPAKQKRDRSESLTRRIRATFESRRRGSSETGVRSSNGFIGGAKLMRERGDSSAPSTPAIGHGVQGNKNDNDLARSALDPPSTPGSGHGLDESACNSPSVLERSQPSRAPAASPHQLRHRTTFSGRRSVSGQSGESASAEASSANADARRERGRGRWAAANEGSHAHHESNDDEHDRHDQPSSARPTMLRKAKPAAATDVSPIHRQAGYPPSVPYTSTVAVTDNLPSPMSATSLASRRRSSSVNLGQSHHHPAGASSSSVFTTSEERRPRAMTRSSGAGGARRRSMSAVRSIRDAAIGVFQRRAGSRATSQVRDTEEDRLSTGVSIVSQERQHQRQKQHQSEHQHHYSGGQEDDFEDFHDAISAMKQQEQQQHHDHNHRHVHQHPHGPRVLDRPSDGSSISSYETSLSHPSSVTTPNTSRPQSERGMVAHPTGLEASKNPSTKTTTMQGAGEHLQQHFDRWAAEHEADFFELPSQQPTPPPLAPKSSKRVLVNNNHHHHHAGTVAREEAEGAAVSYPKAEQQQQRREEEGLWSRSAVPLDDEDGDMEAEPKAFGDAAKPAVNYSRESLIPQPLSVSPRNSTHLVRLQLEDDEGRRRGHSSNHSAPSSLSLSLRGGPGAKFSGMKSYTSFPESESSSNLHRRSGSAELVRLQKRTLSSKPGHVEEDGMETTISSRPSSRDSKASAATRPDIPERRHRHGTRSSLQHEFDQQRPTSSGTVSSSSGQQQQEQQQRHQSRQVQRQNFHAQRQQHREDENETQHTVAKMFVECCRCRFYLDMPSRVYECMVHPEGTVEDTDLGVHGVVTRLVRCPWCGHGLKTRCCAGYAAVVHLEERLH